METNRPLLWLIGKESMAGANVIFNRVLLPLQLCLGLWQIAKLTPLWALISCTKSWLIMKLFPGMISYACSDYNQLKQFDDRVFKRVQFCYVTTRGDVPTASARKEDDQMYAFHVIKRKDSKVKENNIDEKHDENAVQVNYLGDIFQLERKEINNFMDDHVLKYYITDEIWRSIKYLSDVAAKADQASERDQSAKRDQAAKGIVFIKNHKEIWEEVVTGRVMSLEEVLDSVILHGQTLSRLDHDYFLPVDLILSEERILKVLNLFGLFLQTQKHIHWLVPALLSLTSAVMGFSTTLRRWVYSGINMLSCRAIHFVCDQLYFSWRRQVYSLGNWIENLNPSNDLQSMIVRDNYITVLIAGGAKINIRVATLVDFQSRTLGNFAASIDRAFEGKKEPVDTFPCYPFDIECKFKCGTFEIVCRFEQNKDRKANNGRCSVEAGEIASVDVDCSREYAKKLFRFAAYMAQNKSGSLKSYDPQNCKTVYVRRFREWVMEYVRSGYPKLYELTLENVVVR